MILLWCPSWYLKYKATYLNILLESIMPKKPAVEPKMRQVKKKQDKSIRSTNKRQKPDLIIYDRFPQLGKPTFVQKDKYTGVNIPVFI